MDALKRKIFGTLYRNILKPILFLFDAEACHNLFTFKGNLMGEFGITRKLTSLLFNYSNPKLEKTVLGVKFRNPIGLSAGFDYDAKMVKIMPSVGFGFETVGTVTNIAYEGNTKPRLGRLQKSKSLLVNKGFKNDGVDIISKRLMDPYLRDVTFGVSVGSSNVPQIDSIDKAITDILACFNKLKTNSNIKYFELNISCPNISMPESFTTGVNFEKLASEVSKLRLSVPIFLKMHNELSIEKTEELVAIAVKYGINGFIFSNLVKDRANPEFDKDEIKAVEHLAGNFSGRPTQKNSLALIKHFRNKYGNKIAIIGCGGVFGYEDAKSKLDAGADLVQMITGMIFEGPQVVGEINSNISRNL